MTRNVAHGKASSYVSQLVMGFVGPLASLSDNLHAPQAPEEGPAASRVKARLIPLQGLEQGHFASGSTCSCSVLISHTQALGGVWAQVAI